MTFCRIRENVYVTIFTYTWFSTLPTLTTYVTWRWKLRDSSVQLVPVRTFRFASLVQSRRRERTFSDFGSEKTDSWASATVMRLTTEKSARWVVWRVLVGAKYRKSLTMNLYASLLVEAWLVLRDVGFGTNGVYTRVARNIGVSTA